MKLENDRILSGGLADLGSQGKFGECIMKLL